MDENDPRARALDAARHMTGVPGSGVNNPDDVVSAAEKFLEFLNRPLPDSGGGDESGDSGGSSTYSGRSRRGSAASTE